MVGWCVGEITGAVADTMEKQTSKLDGELWGVDFHHPSKALIFFEEVSIKRDSHPEPNRIRS